MCGVTCRSVELQVFLLPIYPYLNFSKFAELRNYKVLSALGFRYLI